MRHKSAPAVLLVALALVGCGENAAENVPKAVVAPAKDVKPSGAADASLPAPTTIAAPAGPLAITSATSKIEFIGSKKVGGAHNGGFKTFNGSVELVSGKPEVKAISVDIDTASIFADDDKLTGHLKNADFFDVPNSPRPNSSRPRSSPAAIRGPRTPWSAT